MLSASPAASSVLAIVTTVHLGLAVLRNHRDAPPVVSLLAVVSMFLAATPWLYPSPIGLTLGLTVHLAWFTACELLAPPAPRQPSSDSRPSQLTSGTTGTTGTTGGVLKHFVPVPVLAVVDETPGIRTIRLARPDGFDFVPGQFLTVRVRLDGREHARCYSVSSAPEARGYLEISVRRQGIVSNALHASVRPGSMLAIKGPLGAFKYPSDDDRPIVLIAGGIGITPLVSMLRHMAYSQPTRPAILLYSARTAEDFAFRDELAALARRHPQIHVHLAVSGGRGGPGVYSGRIDEALLLATAPDLAHSICFICGPGSMIEAMKSLLASLGVPPAQIRHELFDAAIAASREHPARTLGGPGSRGATHAMTCARTGRQVPIAAGQTLLEAAEAGGVAVESLCRAGVCGTCRVRVDAGEVACASDTLDPHEQQQGFVLACVTTTATDCTVDV